jgi:hypothetical protein
VRFMAVVDRFELLSVSERPRVDRERRQGY